MGTFEIQREPLKFHTKYLTHALKEMIFTACLKFKNSHIYDLVHAFWNAPMSYKGIVTLENDFSQYQSSFHVKSAAIG